MLVLVQHSLAFSLFVNPLLSDLIQIIGIRLIHTCPRYVRVIARHLSILKIAIILLLLCIGIPVTRMVILLFINRTDFVYRTFLKDGVFFLWLFILLCQTSWRVLPFLQFPLILTSGGVSIGSGSFVFFVDLPDYLVCVCVCCQLF